MGLDRSSGDLVCWVEPCCEQGLGVVLEGQDLVTRKLETGGGLGEVLQGQDQLTN